MNAAPLGSRYLSLRLARRMRHAQHAYERLPADAPGLTLDGLLNLHGQSGIPTLLMLFALFCIVPVGGVGNVFGVALWMLSWDVWQGRSDMRLPNRLASFRLNRRWSIHMLHGLGSGYRQASRWLRPRWPAMQAPWTRGPWALWIALQALIIFLPVPLGNILPSFSLIALGLGQIIKDGMLLWASLPPWLRRRSWRAPFCGLWGSLLCHRCRSGARGCWPQHWLRGCWQDC